MGLALPILHDAGELRRGLLRRGVVVAVEGLAHHRDDHVEQQDDAEEDEAVRERQAGDLARVWVRVRARARVRVRVTNPNPNPNPTLTLTLTR